MFPMPENIFGSIGSFVGGSFGSAGFNAANNEDADQPISLSIGSFNTDGANWDPTKWGQPWGGQLYPNITIPYPSTTVPYSPISISIIPEIITIYPNGQEGSIGLPGMPGPIGIPGMDSEEEIIVLPKDPIKKRNALRELLKEDKPVEEEREGRRIDLGEEEVE